MWRLKGKGKLGVFEKGFQCDRGKGSRVQEGGSARLGYNTQSLKGLDFNQGVIGIHRRVLNQERV